MCGVVSAITDVFSSVASAVFSPVAAAVGLVGSSLFGGKQEQPAMPAAPVLPPQAQAAPVLPPQAQAAQAPDEQARRASQRSAGPVGPAGGAAASGTMLTGPGGITNDLLNLGKNSLLGQ